MNSHLERVFFYQAWAKRMRGTPPGPEMYAYLKHEARELEFTLTLKRLPENRILYVQNDGTPTNQPKQGARQ